MCRSGDDNGATIWIARRISERLRARRAAKRHGLKARKTRWRRSTIDNLGGFAIVNPLNRGIFEGFRYELTAEEVIEYCQAR